MFTTSAVDNIDHNPTATSAHGSFYGTGISLFQHPEVENRGNEQTCVAISKSGKKVGKLPDSYALVLPIAVIKNEPLVPELCSLVQSSCNLLTEAVTQEYKWCDHICKVVEANSVENGDKDLHVSWAAYHANMTVPTETTDHIPKTVSTLLPLFPDDSKSIAMIRHSMDVVKDAVSVLNPGQSPVIVCDQPLFKIAKQIQWMWPETYGEGSFVIMLGGLHIKMALFKALGDSFGWQWMGHLH